MIKNSNLTLEQIHDKSILLDTKEIFLNPTNDDTATDSNLAVDFIKNLRILELINKDNIVVHQYNSGGDQPAGFAIYDAIKASQCFITIIAHGECQSIGMLILQAADLRLVMPNCELMLHEGSSGINSDLSHKAAKSWAVLEKKKEELFYDIFTEKCISGKFFQDRNYKKSRIKGYLRTQMAKNEDWIISAQEAEEYGFIDGIIGSDKYPNINSIINI